MLGILFLLFKSQIYSIANPTDSKNQFSQNVTGEETSTIGQDKNGQSAFTSSTSKWTTKDADTISVTQPTSDQQHSEQLHVC